MAEEWKFSEMGYMMRNYINIDVTKYLQPGNVMMIK
jgi:hypothetical protein